MATHTHLPIYKVAYDLLDVVTSLVKNMQRDYKRSIGEKISTEIIEITVLIFRANVAQDIAPGRPQPPRPGAPRQHLAPARPQHQGRPHPNLPEALT